MKASLFLCSLFLLTGSIVLPTLARAQAGGDAARLSFLSETDRAHYLRVREETLAKNPDLKKEQDSLTQERQSMQGGQATQDQRKTFIQNVLAHAKNMRAAMLKDDPSIAPVLDQVDAKMKERFKQRAAQGGGAAP